MEEPFLETSLIHTAVLCNQPPLSVLDALAPLSLIFPANILLHSFSMLQIIVPCPSVRATIQIVIRSLTMFQSIIDLSFIPFTWRKYVNAFATETVVLPLSQIDVSTAILEDTSAYPLAVSHFALIGGAIAKLFFDYVCQEVSLRIVNIFFEEGLQNISLFFFKALLTYLPFHNG